MTSEKTAVAGVAIAQEVRRFVRENYLFGQDDGLKDDDSFLEMGIIDSTGVLELVSYLENTFGIRVESEELNVENLDSLNRICAYLEGKMNAARLT